MFKGQALGLVGLLGIGATASVYRCRAKVDGKEEEFAVKVLESPLSADRELAVLAKLADEVSVGRSSIPICCGRLDLPSQGFLLRPVGTTLATDGMLQQHPQLYKSIQPMVGVLRAVHKLGYVHRDLRLPNLMMAGSDLVILDW